MKFHRTITVAAALLVPVLAEAERVNLILDTDIGNDIDDTLALAMIHAVESRGEVDLLAVTTTKDNRFAGPFADLINTFYRRPNIPIGVVHNGKTPEDSPMIRIPAERKGTGGGLVYPHRLLDGLQAEEAVHLLRRTLEQHADGSVTIAQIGFSTNLARLIESEGGLELVRHKVKTLYAMAGNYAKPEPEYNIYTDPEAARILLERWPTPIVFSGFEVGSAILFPHEAIAGGFPYAVNHPVAEAYRIFLPKLDDRPAWDPTAVLEAVRPGRYFELSPAGRVSLGPKNITVFDKDPQGRHRYLIVNPDRVAEIRQLLADLVTEPPSVQPHDGRQQDR